jgi:hypothetical protein
MQVLGIKPNLIVAVSVLLACAYLLALEQCNQIHGYATRTRFESNVVVVVGLVDSIPNVRMLIFPMNCLKECLTKMLYHGMQSLLVIPRLAITMKP